jgi:hypothetical protein
MDAGRVVAARRVVEHFCEEMKPFRDDLRRWPSPQVLALFGSPGPEMVDRIGGMNRRCTPASA